MDMKNMILGVVGVVVSVILISNMYPTALSAVYAINLSLFAWAGVDDTATQAIVQLWPLFIAIGGLLIFVSYMRE